MEIESLFIKLKAARAKGADISQIEFCRMVRLVIEQGIVAPMGLSRRFKVSVSTIHRWQHTNAPHPTMRESVIAGLMEEVQKHLN